MNPQESLSSKSSSNEISSNFPISTTSNSESSTNALSNVQVRSQRWSCDLESTLHDHSYVCTQPEPLQCPSSARPTSGDTFSNTQAERCSSLQLPPDPCPVPLVDANSILQPASPVPSPSSLLAPESASVTNTHSTDVAVAAIHDPSLPCPADSAELTTPGTKDLTASKSTGLAPPDITESGLSESTALAPLDLTDCGRVPPNLTKLGSADLGFAACLFTVGGALQLEVVNVGIGGVGSGVRMGGAGLVHLVPLLQAPTVSCIQ